MTPATHRVAIGLLALGFAGMRCEAGTVALWLFDDPVGARVARDSSGHGYDLTLGPGAAIVEHGKYGHALDADAADVPGPGAFRYHAEKALNPDDSDWTLECWLKAKPGMRDDNRIWGLSDVNYIDLGRSRQVPKPESGLFIASRFLPIDGVTAWNKPTGNLKVGGFHHFAFVYDSAAKELRHYFDGRLQFTAKGTWRDVYTGGDKLDEAVFPPNYPVLQIGMRDAIQQWSHRTLGGKWKGMKRFHGLIDEMRFSDAALYTRDFTPPESFARGRSAVSPAHPSSGAEDRYVSPDSVRQVGDRKELFIDRRFIEASANIRLKLNPPEKFAVEFDRSKGKSSGMFLPRNVFFDEGRRRFRMYYLSGRNIWCMESDDGVRWEPVVQNGGRVTLEGTDAKGGRVTRSPRGVAFGAIEAPPLHGIDGGVVKPLGTMVVYDPHDVPERRYKVFQEVSYLRKGMPGAPGGDAGRNRRARELTGVYGYYSGDGLVFRPSGVRVLPVLTEGLFNAFWDEAAGRYLIYVRCQNIRDGRLASIQGNQFIYRPGFSYDHPDGFIEVVSPDTGTVPGFENLRSIACAGAKDLLQPWTIGVSPDAERKTIYSTSDQLAPTLVADRWDGFKDFYMGFALRYPYADSVYLMSALTFRHLHPSREPWFPQFKDANGPLEGILAVSRDGLHWDRLDREAYIPLGLMDEWDRARTCPGLGLIKVGSYVYQYYWGGAALHDGPPIPGHPVDRSRSAPGMAGIRQRLDGFVSADADYRGGWLTTPPIVFSGGRLTINENCGGQGTLFVELRDPDGRPIPGYTLGDCEEVFGNDVNWEVHWRGSADVSRLAGRPVKLQFRMTNAKLYGFQFRPLP